MAANLIGQNPNSSLYEDNEADDIEAWCNLFGVSENDLYLMTEKEIHQRLDECENKKLKKSKKPDFKQSLYNHLNLRNFKIRSPFKRSEPESDQDQDNVSVISLEEEPAYSNEEESVVEDNDFLENSITESENIRQSLIESQLLQESIMEDRKRGGGNCEEEDSSYLFQVLCELASELESAFGEDIFNKTGIIPCISKNSVTQFNISSCGCGGDSFDTSILFDYDNNIVYFNSVKNTANEEITTTKEIPLHKNPYECMFDNLLCDGGDDDGVVQIITYQSNTRGDKKSTIVSYGGNTTEDTHTTRREVEEDVACTPKREVQQPCTPKRQVPQQCYQTNNLDDSFNDFGNHVYAAGRMTYDALDDVFGDCEISPLQYNVEDCPTPLQFDPMIRKRRGVFGNPDYEYSPGVWCDPHNTPGKQIPYHNPQEEMLKQRMEAARAKRASPVTRRNTGAFDLAKIQPRRLQLNEQSQGTCPRKNLEALKAMFNWR